MQKHTEKRASQASLAAPRRAALARTRTLQRGAIVSPPAMMSARKPAWVSVKAVGTFVPKLTQKSFEKYGFSTATLLTDWARIVGQDLARDTMPERLKWPRGVAEQREKTGEVTGLGGATLVLRVDPARALDISYKERQIVERINTYFGYRAVSELRIIQAPVSSKSEPASRQTLRVPMELGQPATPVSPDDALAQALARLEAGVMNRAHTSRIS
jgi:hypothetical protein